MNTCLLQLIFNLTKKYLGKVIEFLAKGYSYELESSQMKCSPITKLVAEGDISNFVFSFLV